MNVLNALQSSPYMFLRGYLFALVITIIVSRARRPSARCALSQPDSREPAIYHGPSRGVQLRLDRGRAGQDRV